MLGYHNPFCFSFPSPLYCSCNILTFDSKFHLSIAFFKVVGGNTLLYSTQGLRYIFTILHHICRGFGLGIIHSLPAMFVPSAQVNRKNWRGLINLIDLSTQLSLILGIVPSGKQLCPYCPIGQNGLDEWPGQPLAREPRRSLILQSVRACEVRFFL